MKTIDEELGMLTEEKDAIASSVALNKILYRLLTECKRREARLWGIIMGLIATIIVGIVGFLLYESQFTTETTETTWEYSEVSGENASINNVQGNQYNDESTHNDSTK